MTRRAMIFARPRSFTMETSAAQFNRCIKEPDARFVLFQGPRWGDASFLGAWLTEAAKAEALWTEALENPEFKQKIDRLCIACLPHFGMAASSFLMDLRAHLTSFVLTLENEEGDEFVMMAEMGFFVLSGYHYRMAIPSGLTLASVKAAALAYAATEDKELYLHPECLVTTMSFAEASKLQDRLCAIEKLRDCDPLSLPKA